MVLEALRQFYLNLRWVNWLDIAIVGFLIYRILLLIKGTRAMQMLTGLGILGIAFVAASRFGLYTTDWVLAHFFDYLILIVIVLFQDDLRRALTHVGKSPFVQAGGFEVDQEMIDEVARAALQLAKERTGALIVIERETSLRNFIETGSFLDARVRSELLYAIFNKDSPIHDGAVIISGNRVSAAGCFLPLSKDPDIDKRYGSRHRAAFGISEESDAVVVVVSEESGEAHVVRSGKISEKLNEAELRHMLEALLDLAGQIQNMPKRMRAWIQAIRRGQPRRKGGGS